MLPQTGHQRWGAENSAEDMVGKEEKDKVIVDAGSQATEGSI